MEKTNYSNLQDVSLSPVIDTNKQMSKKQRSESKLLNSELDKNADGNDINLNEWKPDLSGWDVTIGLPTGL